MSSPDEPCTCDYVELRPCLSMRVYDGTCGAHRATDPPEYVKDPVDQTMNLVDWYSSSCA